MWIYYSVTLRKNILLTAKLWTSSFSIFNSDFEHRVPTENFDSYREFKCLNAKLWKTLNSKFLTLTQSFKKPQKIIILPHPHLLKKLWKCTFKT